MKTSKIEEEVRQNPGITFTELKEKLGLANGQLQYHLKKSKARQKKKGYVVKETCSRCRHEEECHEKCIRRILRDEKNKKILKMLEKGCKKKKIAEELNISPSTLSHHIRKLEKAGVKTPEK